MNSLWLARATRPETDKFQAGDRFEVVVVGAGLTGLTAALLLARKGKKVALVEGRQIGAVATGNTTAKVSLLQGTRFSELLERHSEDVVRAYLQANRAGQQWLAEYCRESDIGIETRDAYSYAVSKEAASRVDEEVRACGAVGLHAEKVATPELPFATQGAVRVAEQFQIDPMVVCNQLCRDFRQQGGLVFEDTRVTGMEVGDLAELKTTQGSVFAQQIILATGFPVLDGNWHFARLEPHRSYYVALRTTGERPRGMYLSVDHPTRSLRTAQMGDEELLLVGGNHHIVGREESARERLNDLERWAYTHFGPVEVAYSWSAQDYRMLDGLPQVIAEDSKDQLMIATGFDKWGMTNGPAAALTLAGRVLGSEPDWARVLYRRSSRDLTGQAARAVQQNGTVFLEMARGWGSALASTATPAPSEGQGHIRFEGLKAVGVCRVGGKNHKISAVCPHLGGILHWNDAEQSWDCPLHGSRFSPEGHVLEGPSLKGCSSLPR